MLRLLGAGMTVAGCASLGFGTCRRMQRRIHTLRELTRMAVMLSAEITYAHADLKEAFGHIEKRVSEPLSSFLRNVKRQMEEGECGLLGDIFQNRIREDLAPGGLTGEDMQNLGTLGEQLGYLDVQMQKRTLDYYLQQVNEAYEQARREYQEKEKMVRCLGIGAGVFLVILLC